MIQCTHVPTGASGSSEIIAMLFVPSGSLFHKSGGEISCPSQVNLEGIF